MRAKPFLTALLFIGLSAQQVFAQACGGTPALEGQNAVDGQVGFTEGAVLYGAGITANLRGPFSIGLGYSIGTYSDIDNVGHGFSGAVGYELPVPNFSICPIVSAGYFQVTEPDIEPGIDATVSELAGSFGLGLGTRIEAGPNLFVTLTGEPYFMRYRTRVEATQGGVSGSITESQNDFGVDLGFSLGTGAFYAGAGVTLTTIENSEPIFSINLGFLIGGKR